MSYKLRYLTQAQEDLLQIKRYISKETGNRKIGLQFTEKLRKQCSNLASLSGTIGQHRTELKEGIRSFPCSGYIIFFRYHGEYLEIISFVEGHRDVTALFTEDE